MAGILKTSINLSEIPKDKIIDGKKGKYLPITITINNELDKFGNNGSVVVEQTKEERESKLPKIYLGNVKILWSDNVMPQPAPREGQPQSFPKAPAYAAPAPADDLPF